MASYGASDGGPSAKAQAAGRKNGSAKSVTSANADSLYCESYSEETSSSDTLSSSSSSESTDIDFLSKDPAKAASADLLDDDLPAVIPDEVAYPLAYNILYALNPSLFVLLNDMTCLSFSRLTPRIRTFINEASQEFANRNLEAAKNACYQCIQENPNVHEVYDLLDNIFSEEGDVERALEFRLVSALLTRRTDMFLALINHYYTEGNVTRMNFCVTKLLACLTSLKAQQDPRITDGFILSTFHTLKILYFQYPKLKLQLQRKIIGYLQEHENIILYTVNYADALWERRYRRQAVEYLMSIFMGVHERLSCSPAFLRGEVPISMAVDSRLSLRIAQYQFQLGMYSNVHEFVSTVELSYNAYRKQHAPLNDALVSTDLRPPKLLILIDVAAQAFLLFSRVKVLCTDKAHHSALSQDQPSAPQLEEAFFGQLPCEGPDNLSDSADNGVVRAKTECQNYSTNISAFCSSLINTKQSKSVEAAMTESAALIADILNDESSAVHNTIDHSIVSGSSAYERHHAKDGSASISSDASPAISGNIFLQYLLVTVRAMSAIVDLINTQVMHQAGVSIYALSNRQSAPENSVLSARTAKISRATSSFLVDMLASIATQLMPSVLGVYQKIVSCSILDTERCYVHLLMSEIYIKMDGVAKAAEHFACALRAAEDGHDLSSTVSVRISLANFLLRQQRVNYARVMDILSPYRRKSLFLDIPPDICSKATIEQISLQPNEALYILRQRLFAFSGTFDEMSVYSVCKAAVNARQPALLADPCLALAHLFVQYLQHSREAKAAPMELASTFSLNITSPNALFALDSSLDTAYLAIQGCLLYSLLVFQSANLRRNRMYTALKPLEALLSESIRCASCAHHRPLDDGASLSAATTSFIMRRNHLFDTCATYRAINSSLSKLLQQDSDVPTDESVQPIPRGSFLGSKSSDAPSVSPGPRYVEPGFENLLHNRRGNKIFFPSGTDKLLYFLQFIADNNLDSPEELINFIFYIIDGLLKVHRAYAGFAGSEECVTKTLLHSEACYQFRALSITSLLLSLTEALSVGAKESTAPTTTDTPETQGDSCTAKVFFVPMHEELASLYKRGTLDAQDLSGSASRRKTYTVEGSERDTYINTCRRYFLLRQEISNKLYDMQLELSTTYTHYFTVSYSTIRERFSKNTNDLTLASYICRCISRTNKSIISRYFYRLNTTANSQNVVLLYSAAVCFMISKGMSSAISCLTKLYCILAAGEGQRNVRGRLRLRLSDISLLLAICHSRSFGSKRTLTHSYSYCNFICYLLNYAKLNGEYRRETFYNVALLLHYMHCNFDIAEALYTTVLKARDPVYCPVSLFRALTPRYGGLLRVIQQASSSITDTDILRLIDEVNAANPNTAKHPFIFHQLPRRAQIYTRTFIQDTSTGRKSGALHASLPNSNGVRNTEVYTLDASSNGLLPGMEERASHVSQDLLVFSAEMTEAHVSRTKKRQVSSPEKQYKASSPENSATSVPIIISSAVDPNVLDEHMDSYSISSLKYALSSLRTVSSRLLPDSATLRVTPLASIESSTLHGRAYSHSSVGAANDSQFSYTSYEAECAYQLYCLYQHVNSHDAAEHVLCKYLQL